MNQKKKGKDHVRHKVTRHFAEEQRKFIILVLLLMLLGFSQIPNFCCTIINILEICCLL